MVYTVYLNYKLEILSVFFNYEYYFPSRLVPFLVLSCLFFSQS